MRLLSPKSNHLQQGSIFNCLRVPRYESCSCSGLVLTARCDLEHCKQSVISFLPIVSIDDWLERDFCRLLADRLQKSIRTEIHEKLCQAGITAELVEIYTLEQVIERELVGKARTAAQELAAQLASIDCALKTPGHKYSDIVGLVGKKTKVAERLLEDLVQQRLPEYYYLNDVDVSRNSDEGYVVLLRGMVSLPTENFAPICEGIETDQIRARKDINSWLDPDADAICLITGVLRTPDIEHLTQTFAQLFVRIGLEDQTGCLVGKLNQITKKIIK
jgi:hypothetical protein